MQKIISYCTLFTILFVFGLFAQVNAAGYPGFIEIKDKECIILDDTDIQKLPSVWHKYNGFIKKCEFKRGKNSKAIVSLVSIWAIDYLDAQKKSMWEDFSCTLIVDNKFNTVAVFPEHELYPINQPCSLYVYYGKWKGGIPTEIRIDVDNPAVSGDYYYAPLIWNDKDKKYYMKDMEEKSGKRPK